MKHADNHLTPMEADQFGLASAALLRKGSQALPTHIKDRLYAARMRAIAARKPEKVRILKQVLAGSSGSLSSGHRGSRGIWDVLGWVAPLIVLVFGLIGIAQWQEDSRIDDIAAVDAALLTDDVPPDAYADSGFMGFLKNGPSADTSSDVVSSPRAK